MDSTRCYQLAAPHGGKGFAANPTAREQAAEPRGGCPGALHSQPPVGAPCHRCSGAAQGPFLPHFCSSLPPGSRPVSHQQSGEQRHTAVWVPTGMARGRETETLQVRSRYPLGVPELATKKAPGSGAVRQRL